MVNPSDLKADFNVLASAGSKTWLFPKATTLHPRAKVSLNGTGTIFIFLTLTTLR